MFGLCRGSTLRGVYIMFTLRNMIHVPSINCEEHSLCFLIFLPLSSLNIWDKICVSEPSSLSFMLLSVFPPSSFTSVVIYLLFCRNVVDMCLAFLHAALICSRRRNQWSRPTKLQPHRSALKQTNWRFLTVFFPVVMSTTREHPLLIVSHFWPNVLLWNHHRAVSLGSTRASGEQTR